MLFSCFIIMEESYLILQAGFVGCSDFIKWSFWYMVSNDLDRSGQIYRKLCQTELYHECGAKEVHHLLEGMGVRERTISSVLRGLGLIKKN